MDIIQIKGDNVKNKKIKYIIKKTLIIILIAFSSIFIYQIFEEIKKNNNSNDVYGTKLSADEGESSNTNVTYIINDASKSVVGISKIKDNGSSAFLTNSAENLGLGTGIVVSKNGYILTNQHVVGNTGTMCYVTLENGTIYNGKIVWANSDIDLAVIKINEYLKDVARIGDANTISVGENVYAIGNPIGYEFQRTVTGGIISAQKRTVKIKNSDETYSYMSNLIQTDATINPGNSGGPLIDEEGNVIGINTIKITSAEGIGFAIPINIIKPIIEKFDKYGKFEEAYLGIFAYDNSVMQYIKNSNTFSRGIYIENIISNGPADKTELKKGDIIVKIDNTNISKMSELQEYIFMKNPGDEIVLFVEEKDSTKEIKIQLGKK